jgi:hypothetical protein
MGRKSGDEEKGVRRGRALTGLCKTSPKSSWPGSSGPSTSFALAVEVAKEVFQPPTNKPCAARRPRLHSAPFQPAAFGGTAGAQRAPTSRGEVAEWLNAPHSKCGIRATVSGVRIPPSPPNVVDCPWEQYRTCRVASNGAAGSRFDTTTWLLQRSTRAGTLPSCKFATRCIYGEDSEG